MFIAKGTLAPCFCGVPRVTSSWIAGFVALFMWWFSTGVLLWRVRYADNVGGDAHFRSVVFGLPMLFAGIAGLHFSLDDTSINGVYFAFLSALGIWGWIELAFLSGVITGPNTAPCPPNAAFGERLQRAVGTIAYHEALLITALILIGFASYQMPNQFALLTFAVLFFARISAKLNLFLGVPRINVEFLPRPLSHLASHFRNTKMNGFFPFAVTALTFAAGCWMERAVSAPTDARQIGFVLLSALTLLALLEHWFMVLPLPDQKLWRWMMPALKSKTSIATPSLDSLKENSHGL
jgi:putative photosynthetic complex assembly protein 2